jgi:ParB/RepB/Spo0J family partition protein
MALTDMAGVARANSLLSIPPDLIEDGDNSRRWPDTDVLELAMDILEHGQIVPAVVAYTKDPDGAEHISMVEGHRRLAAVRYINEQGLYTGEDGKVVKLSIRCENVNKKVDRFDVSVAGNLQRKGLSAIDLAHDINIMKSKGRTQTEIAKKLGISEPTVSRTLKLLTLPVALQKKIHKGEIAAETGYELASMTPEERDAFLAGRAKPAPATQAQAQGPGGAAATAADGATTPAAAPDENTPEPQDDGRLTTEKVRKAKREAAEAGAETRGPKDRSRKVVYNQFEEWAGCDDGTIEDPIIKHCKVMVRFMDGTISSQGVLRSLRTLAEGE